MKSNHTVLKDQYYKKVIDLYTKEHLSMWQISKIIPLDRSTIWRWISTFAAYDQESCVMEKKEIETPDSLEHDRDWRTHRESSGRANKQHHQERVP